MCWRGWKKYQVFINISKGTVDTDVGHYVSDIQHLTLAVLIQYQRKFCWTKG